MPVVRFVVAPSAIAVFVRGWRDGAHIAANIAVRIRGIIVDMRRRILDAAGFIRAVCVGACMPVVRFVVAPSTVTVFVRGWRDGAHIAANIANGVLIIVIDMSFLIQNAAGRIGADGIGAGAPMVLCVRTPTVIGMVMGNHTVEAADIAGGVLLVIVDMRAFGYHNCAAAGVRLLMGFLCGDPLCGAGVMFGILLTIAGAADLAECGFQTGGGTAGTGSRFGVRRIMGADSAVGAVLIGGPVAIIMAERVARFKGRFIGGSCRTQAADGAGFVIHRLFGAGRGSFQIFGICRFGGEVVGQQVAVGLAAVGAHGLLRTGCRAAGVLAEGDCLIDAEPIALRRRGRGDKAEAAFAFLIGSCGDGPRAEAVNRGDRLAAAGRRKFIAVAGIDAALRQPEGEGKVLCTAHGIRAGDREFGDGLALSLAIAEFAFAPILPVLCLPLVGMGRMDGHGKCRGIARLVRGNDGLRCSRVAKGDLALFVGGHGYVVDGHGVQIQVGHGEGLIALATENVAILRAGDRRGGLVDDDLIRIDHNFTFELSE